MNSDFNLDHYIMHHVLNSHEWLLPFSAPIQLPGILTTHALMVLIGCALIMMLFLVFYRKNERVPTGLTNCLEALVVFVRDDVARLRDKLRLSNEAQQRLEQMAQVAAQFHASLTPPDRATLQTCLFVHGQKAARDGLSLAQCTSGASVTRSGTAWRCILEPMRARLASSCSRKGMSAVEMETTWEGAISI